MLPAFVLIGLSCRNAARNRYCSTCRDNVLGSFPLTRVNFVNSRYLFYYLKLDFLTFIFLQISQYCYIPYGQTKNPIPKTDGANEGETIINANKIL